MAFSIIASSGGLTPKEAVHGYGASDRADGGGGADPAHVDARRHHRATIGAARAGHPLLRAGPAHQRDLRAVRAQPDQRLQVEEALPREAPRRAHPVSYTHLRAHETRHEL